MPDEYTYEKEEASVTWWGSGKYTLNLRLGQVSLRDLQEDGIEIYGFPISQAKVLCENLRARLAELE